MAISVGVAVVGLILLVFEVRPHRQRIARFDTDHDTWLLVRRSTESYLARRLTTAVPTSPIKARLKPKGRWRLKVTARAASSTRATLEAAAKSELARLHAPEARVQVKTTGRAKGS